MQLTENKPLPFRYLLSIQKCNDLTNQVVTSFKSHSITGLVGITFGKNEPDRNGLFATVMNGPVDVAGNRITGVLDEARLSPGMQAELFGQREENGYANPVIVTLDLMP